jgi:hypothetical protein
MGRERTNLFLKCHSLQKSKSNLIPKFQQTNKIIMRKVYKTIALSIYYSHETVAGTKNAAADKKKKPKKKGRNM